MTAALLPTMAVSVLLGGAFSAGVLLMFATVPQWGAPRLADRIQPYVRHVADPRGLTPLDPVATLGNSWTVWRARVVGALGGGEAVAARLAAARWEIDVARFRARQLGWALAGAGVGAAVAVGIVIARSGTALLVVLPVLTAAAGAVLCDVTLTTAARRRQHRIREELPTVLEFLALCLSAGESLLDALRRVSAVGSGELTAEFGRVVVAVASGMPLAAALRELSRDVAVPALSRAVDQLTSALDRGTPLAGVLEAQAGDAREDAKRSLLEAAGRKEIAMLLPLVFVILPLSVLFAIFPGIVMLRFGMG
ncbi:MAG: type II secretion system F family protein [Microbacterium ginsengisoli]|uniref:type II secretion system F family protein n=1 Tax=Microbacterium TaxID=33882 RepID=UPI0006FC2031|nr:MULTISPECIES: type II secretion system F family protein [unclassified Microbacterium]MBN9199722.1 type II secretion system F family protein [Microbacterium ginsengisoli]KQR90983.1 type II secretion protein F [Microbacterium sp. Leaf347]KQS00019.1 type II secretion protein F [Microbacterium sp. Leaf351]ODU74394.1 MAG: type II secretion protein F [Microbacterium sp. SCN 71-21]OJU75248.1 MAG: type II secretion protein F [Microbacterium sp. 71-23]